MVIVKRILEGKIKNRDYFLFFMGDGGESIKYGRVVEFRV
jgi:hypothetical protein